jgi:DNA-binding XRE family transcriptional regulator
VSVRAEGPFTGNFNYLLQGEGLVEEAEFRWIRQNFLKTQKEMSELLGVSLKAVQSFEQGWRSIPAYVEGLALFLLAMKRGTCQREIFPEKVVSRTHTKSLSIRGIQSHPAMEPAGQGI